MWRHPLLKAALLFYIGWGGWNWYSDRPFHQPDGVLAADDPQQTTLVDGVRDDGMWIKSSLVRDDTGAGACEILLVSDVALQSQ